MEHTVAFKKMIRSRAASVLSLLLLMQSFCGWAQGSYDMRIRPADAMPERYLPLLQHKKAGLVINQASAVGDSSLLYMLLARGVQVTAIFVPEHGFRGTEDAGAHIGNAIDSATGIPVISLYGSRKKPRNEDLANIDVLVYDLQDVGARFYTYLSTLQYCMQACAQNNKPFIVLDRPDPNGFYVDGPVLDVAHRSFVGMQPIPVVYGMTAGEYAEMLVGEQWADSTAGLNLRVIPCAGYTHSKKYKLPVAPSPNLRTMAAVYAYPSLCLFEGTPISVGRGTAMPFQQFGCPDFAGKYTWSFTPRSGPGATKPPYQAQVCYGVCAGITEQEVLDSANGMLHLPWLIHAYRDYPLKDKFFSPFFTNLSGTPRLAEQIKQGMSEDQIRATWQAGIKAFKKIRKKYLLYKDFEK